MIDVGAVLVTVAAIYWFLISRGFLRWCALALAVLAPLVLVVLHIQAGLLWEMVLSLALVFVAVVCARAALRERGEGKAMPEHPAPAWRHRLPGDESAFRRGQGGEVRPPAEGGGTRRRGGAS